MLKPIHLIAVIGVNIIFAGAYIAGKAGVEHFPPLLFSTLRFILVFLALAPFFRPLTLSRRHLFPFAGFCFSMGIGVYSTMYLALAAADGVSGILIGTQFSVPIAAMLGILILGDKIAPAVWFGIALAFCGVMIVGVDNALLGYWQAFLLILASAFFYALSNVLSRRLAGVIGVLNLNAWMALVSILPLLVLSLLTETDHWEAVTDAGLNDWLALIYSSVIVSLAGHIGMFALLRRYPVAVIMPFYVLTPIFGVIGGIYFFAETPTLKFYLGAAIALFGVWLINRRRAKPGLEPAEA